MAGGRGGANTRDSAFVLSDAFEGRCRPAQPDDFECVNHRHRVVCEVRELSSRVVDVGASAASTVRIVVVAAMVRLISGIAVLVAVDAADKTKVPFADPVAPALALVAATWQAQAFRAFRAILHGEEPESGEERGREW